MADGIDFGEDDGLDIPEGLADRIAQYGKWASDDAGGYEEDSSDETSSWESAWVQTFGGRGADVVQAKQAPEDLFGTDDPQDGTAWLQQFGDEDEPRRPEEPTDGDDENDRDDEGVHALPRRQEQHAEDDDAAPAPDGKPEAPDDLFGADDVRNRTAWLSQFEGSGETSGDQPSRPRPPRLPDTQVPTPGREGMGAMATGVRPPRVPQAREAAQGRRGWHPTGKWQDDAGIQEAAAPVEEKTANGTAIFAMVAAVMALVLGVVPALGLYLLPIPALVGIAAGVAGVVVANRNGGTGRTVARSAIAVALLAVLVAVLTQAVLVAVGVVDASVSAGVMTLTFSF